MSFNSYDLGRMVVLRCNKDNEELYIGGEIYSFNHGEIIKALLDTSDLIWQKVYDIAESLHQKCTLEQNYLKNIKKYLDDPPELDNMIKTANNIMGLPVPEFFKKILLLLPAQTTYIYLTNIVDQVCYPESYWYDIPFQEDKIAKYQSDKKETGFLCMCWTRWLNSLIEGKDNNMWKDLGSYGDSRILLGVIDQYSRYLNNVCFEAKKIRKYLPAIIGLQEPDFFTVEYNREELESWTPRKQLLKENEEKNIFGNMDSRGENAVIASTLSRLIVSEYNNCERYEIVFKRCEFCGGLFTSRKGNNIYCGYPNMAHRGKTCKEIAPRITYVKKRDSTPLKKILNKGTQSYRQWERRIITQDEKSKQDNIKIIEERIKIKHGSVAENEIEKIYKEIKDIRMKWENDAAIKLREYEDGLISEQQCKEYLKIPKIDKRSPLLAEWKRKME